MVNEVELYYGSGITGTSYIECSGRTYVREWDIIHNNKETVCRF